MHISNVFLNEQNVKFGIRSDLNTIVFLCSKTAKRQQFHPVLLPSWFMTHGTRWPPFDILCIGVGSTQTLSLILLLKSIYLQFQG